MPSDLLNGFNAGMRLGQPLVEAKLQKKAFERQAGEREKDRQLTRDEGEATRALAKTRMRKELKQRAKLHAAGITSAETIAGDANQTRKDIAKQASTERQTIAALASTERGDAAKATAAFRQKSLANQATGLARQKARDAEASKTDMERLQETMLENETRKDELKAARGVIWLPPEERRAIDAELRVLESMDAITAKTFDMALASGDPTALAQGMSMLIDKKEVGRKRFVEGVYSGVGQEIRPPGSYDEKTGEFSPLSGQGTTPDEPAKGKIPGERMDDKSKLRIGNDGTLNMPAGPGNAAVDHALRGFGNWEDTARNGGKPQTGPTAGLPSVNGAGAAAGGLGPPPSPTVPTVNLNLTPNDSRYGAPF